MFELSRKLVALRENSLRELSLYDRTCPMTTKIKIKIISDTSDYLVIDKPINLTIHNENTKEVSVLSTLGGSLFPVHRLDKETSGTLVLAKNKLAAALLADQFQNHKVKKVYKALIRGALSPEKIQWKWPLTDKAEGRKNPQGLSKDRKPCLTEGKVLKANDYLSLIEIQIKTGRQHQIRKHAALAKHPIVGDPRYNDLVYNEKISQRFGIERMYLHSAFIEFEWNGKKMTYESPLPPEFKKLMS